MNPRRAGSKPAFTGSDRYIPESREAAIPLRMRAKRVSWNLSPSNSSATITPSCHQIRHREGGAYAIRPYGNSRNPIVPAALACCGMAISFRHTGQRYLRSRSGEKMANTYSRKDAKALTPVIKSFFFARLAPWREKIFGWILNDIILDDPRAGAGTAREGSAGTDCNYRRRR